MTVKEHYDNHLGNFYSWYSGDFDTNKELFKQFCIRNKIRPSGSTHALDLGAGNGVQSFALAELGFKIKAIDFNNQLLAELTSRNTNHALEIVDDDIRLISKYVAFRPELIICCGDTLPHLESFDEVKKILQDSHDILTSKGKILLTFRDYTTDLQDTSRFIPVKSDSERILTCFVEYFSDKIRVTDLLHEFENGMWVQKVSSYYKIRITREMISDYLFDCNFDIIANLSENRMINLIAQKNM